MCATDGVPRFVHELPVHPRVVVPSPNFQMALVSPRGPPRLCRGPSPSGLAWPAWATGALSVPFLRLPLPLLPRRPWLWRLVVPYVGLASCSHCAARSPSSWKGSQSKRPLWGVLRGRPWCFSHVFFFFLLSAVPLSLAPPPALRVPLLADRVPFFSILLPCAWTTQAGVPAVPASHAVRQAATVGDPIKAGAHARGAGRPPQPRRFPFQASPARCLLRLPSPLSARRWCRPLPHPLATDASL